MIYMIMMDNRFIYKQCTVHNNKDFSIIALMHKSFLRVEDWAPIYNNITNPCWLQILRIIDEFEQLVDIQKKQIGECIRQLTTRRIDLIKVFNKYKSSLKYSGQVKKESLQIFDSEKAKYFFGGYYSQVQQIMVKIGNNPRLLARMLAKNNGKKVDNLDFVQSILYHLYPCYLPSTIKSNELNHCLSFVQEIIKQWSYDIKLGRPLTYTIIDQIINGFNKNPQIVCYVEKISMSFMKELNKIKMDCFAFDEEAIKNQIEIKRSMAMSQIQVPQNKGMWEKFKSKFRKKEEQGRDPKKSFHSASDTSDTNDLQYSANQISNMMKIRQRQFLTVVKKTIHTILEMQTPFLLNQMFKFFHYKVSKELSNANNKQRSAESMISQSSIQKNEKLTRNKSQKQKQNSNKQIYRHYCYFLMTNLICEQLHNKFTISHEDSGMKPADLQNITEIIKIITQIFQGHLPEGDKYKNEKLLGQLEQIIPNVQKFYNKIIFKGQYQTEQLNLKTSTNYIGNAEQNEEIRQILLNLHQNTLILSFNDIRSILTIVKSSPLINQLGLSQKTKKIAFMQQPKTRAIFQPTTRRVQFHETKHQVEKIFFVFNSIKPSNKEVIDFYTGNQSPLKDLPLLTKSLMYGSNLNVTQALEVTKSLQLMQNLTLKEVKYFLNKIAIKYSTLYLRESQVLTDKFRETIQLNLGKNIIRKSVLLLHRDSLCSRITFTEKLIQFYTQQLRSSQFYDRISEAFIHNIKIKAYLRIENDELKIYQHVNQMKGVQLQTLLMTDGEPKQKKYSEEYILRNTFKIYTSISELLNTLARSSITRSALSAGRRYDNFNQMFVKLCSIIVSYIEEFLKKREILQNLNKDKLAKTIVSKMQNYIYQKAKSFNILENDLALNMAKQKINKKLFFKKDLESLNVDWNFLFNEGKKKFDLMMAQTSISQRIRHFEDMFKMIFKIISFTMAVNKISAQIINPIIQYLIVESKVTKHYECLYSLNSLRWNTSPETSYNMVLYQSSLDYVSKSMFKDYPLQGQEK